MPTLTPTDRDLARNMLALRGREYTFAQFLRQGARRYTVFVVVGAAGVATLALLDEWQPLWLVVGMLAGAVLRDLGWVRMVRSTWPFTEKVTDWETVRRLAEGEQPPTQVTADSVVEL